MNTDKMRTLERSVVGQALPDVESRLPRPRTGGETSTDISASSVSEVVNFFLETRRGQFQFVSLSKKFAQETKLSDVSSTEK